MSKINQEVKYINESEYTLMVTQKIRILFEVKEIFKVRRIENQIDC